MVLKHNNGPAGRDQPVRFGTHRRVPETTQRPWKSVALARWVCRAEARGGGLISDALRCCPSRACPSRLPHAERTERGDGLMPTQTL